MSVSRHIYKAKLLVGEGYDLPVKSGSVTMDEAWSPHIQATLVVPVPDDALLALLDPRAQRRVELELKAEYPAGERDTVTRTFNLGLRDRSVDHGAGELVLSLASDEALLMDDVFVATSPNTGALANQSSLRTILNNNVLARIGASLQSGTANAPMTAYWDAENLAPNPGLEVDDAGWVVQSNGGPAMTVARQTGSAYRGNARWRLTGTGTNTSVAVLRVGGYFGVRPATRYAVSVWVRSSAAMTVTASARRFTGDDGTGTDSYVGEGASVTLTANTWTRLTYLTPGMPGNAKSFSASVRIATGSMVSGRTLDIDAVTVTEVNAGTSFSVPDFDGSVANTSTYAYEWTGTAHQSSSRRIALTPRDPDSLVWEPGLSAWDFVQPLFQSAGLRLYCDEQRRWYLVDGSTFVAPGQTQLAYAVNLTEAQDTISRDADNWFDAVVVKYTWTAGDGSRKERFDTATTSGGYNKAQLIEFERPYPGNGFAQYVLKRSQGKGRVLDLASVSDYMTTPSQSIVATLPGTPYQTGVVSSVTWNLADDLMRIETRGLTDTPPGAWTLAKPALTWATTDGALTWANATESSSIFI